MDIKQHLGADIFQQSVLYGFNGTAKHALRRLKMVERFSANGPMKGPSLSMICAKNMVDKCNALSAKCMVRDDVSKATSHVA